ncbi:MAG: M28 family peptidase [Bacteroidota bacterium]|nr:M28 family peptidase [Bacteroidota bacterium]
MKPWVVAVIVLIAIRSNAQSIADTITPALLNQYLQFLASDSLKGRGNFTPELRKAAHFIAAEFGKEGLHFFPGTENFFHPFYPLRNTKEKINDSPSVLDSTKILLNVVGVLPSNNIADEAIIFSAHYDHVGTEIGKTDNIFNGANDNASGTAALLALAHYYALRKDNNRTLIFCAFSGEELGLLGSEEFVKYINPSSIKALINIEMIGRHKFGKKAFFVTGEYYSNLASILMKNLKGTGVRVIHEPSIEKKLFMRSDNYAFALKGIPAHSVMSSDDSDECYHQPCDELKRLDVNNMAVIVQAIAIGCRSFIDGSITPKRINAHHLY